MGRGRRQDDQKLILISRPLYDGKKTAARVHALGRKSLCAPILTIADQAADFDGIEDAQALLITSANGLRAFTRHCHYRDLPVFTVGRSSAKAALSRGFRHVYSADGTVEDLCRLVIDRLSCDGGALFHPAGLTGLSVLSRQLTQAGFTCHRKICYRATIVPMLPGSIVRGLYKSDFDTALFFSPRSAGAFIRLVAAYGLCHALRDIKALCLSAAVAKVVQPYHWKSIRTASSPNTDALLELI